METHKIGLPKLPKGYRWRVKKGNLYTFLRIEKRILGVWTSQYRCSVSAMVGCKSAEEQIRTAADYCMTEWESDNFKYMGIIE
jgi:hypothetical protein